MPRLTPEQVQARRRFLLDQEAADADSWWWLSFADADLPKGSQFLGAAIVRAPGFAHAIAKTHALGINPGGEVQCVQYPPDVEPQPEHVDRLLSRREIEEAGI